ncbi:hypothetical protein N9R48_00005 [Rickettsiales bacterium]|jgi:hypothetical protein|nr:hypothetical protein [Rickettsiales bacterium]
MIFEIIKSADKINNEEIITTTIIVVEVIITSFLVGISSFFDSSITSLKNFNI